MIKLGVGVIVFNEGKVLLGKRLSNHGYGMWAFPGGHIEDNESPQECATRETHEETGLAIKDVKIGPWTHDVFATSDKRYITLFVTANYAGGTLEVKEPDKCSEWQWFDWDNLPQPLFQTINSLMALGWSP